MRRGFYLISRFMHDYVPTRDSFPCYFFGTPPFLDVI